MFILYFIIFLVNSGYLFFINRLDNFKKELEFILKVLLERGVKMVV